MPAGEDDAVGGGRRAEVCPAASFCECRHCAKTAECRLLAPRGGSRGSEDCLGDHPQRFRVGIAAEQHAIDVPLFPRILPSL